MTKFFVPGHSEKSGEDLYVWIIRYVEAMTDYQIRPGRIFSLSYAREGQEFRAAVGEVDARTGQLVVAILRADAYLICTPYYGVQRGEPIRVEFGAARGVEYFEGLDHAREGFKVAVEVVDGAAGSLRSRLEAATEALKPVLLEDFPASLAAEFLSLRHKLGWRGSREETIRQMTDGEAADAVAAIRRLYVELLA